MKTEKISLRVDPKLAAQLRKLARRDKREGLSQWIRRVLEDELERCKEDAT